MSDKPTRSEKLPAQLKAVLTQIAEPGKALGEQINEAYLALRNVGREFNNKVEAIGLGFGKPMQPLTDLAASLRDIDPNNTEALVERLRTLSADRYHVWLRLAHQGWFLWPSPEIPAVDVLTLATLLDKGNENVDEFMAKWVEDKIVAIHEILVQRFPVRKDLLDSAFEAHANAKYSLAIPIFLAQADGIYRELSCSRKGVYSKITEKGVGLVPQCKGYVDGLGVDEELLYLLEPLRVVTPLNTSKSHRDPSLLNRHEVMHGTTCDYGTRLNSLKAISHLLYVATFLDGMLSEGSEEGEDASTEA